MWTISFLFIYVLGSRLTLPFVNVNDTSFLGGTAAFLAFSTSITGGNLRSLSLFSVGLSPWMSAMILWQMFSMSKKLGLGSLPLEVQDRRKMILTFVIALIQALAITLNLPIQSGVNYGLVLTMNVLLLIAGTFFLVWLSDLNSLFGVGGSLVILMSSMVSSMPQNILKSIKELQVGPLLIVALLMLSMVFLAIAVRVQRARYRILVNKIMIHNRFKRYSYLDILLNPAGGMPFMYAMSLVSIPQYSLLLLQMVLPKESWIGEWISRFAIGQPIWVFTYIVVLFILGIAFAFVNMNSEEIAILFRKEMRKDFEYYFKVLNKLSGKSVKDIYWNSAQELYNSISEKNKENLKIFIQLIITEVTTNMFSFVDGIATFNELEGPLELYCNGIKVGGSIEEYLRIFFEEEGF